MTAQAMTRINGATLEVPRSLLAGVFALCVAFGLHAVFALQNQANPIQQAGGNTALASQGNSFASFADGVETPEDAEVTPQDQDVVKPAPREPVQAQDTSPVSPETTKITPPVSEPLEPVSEIRPAQLVEAVSGGVPVVPVAPMSPLTESVLEPMIEPAVEPAAKPPVQAAYTSAVKPQQQPPEVIEPTEAVMPEMTPAVQPVQQVENLRPESTTPQQPEPQSPPVTTSLRPPERPVETPVERQKLAQPVAVSKPRGNSEVNATRGVAQSTRSGPGGQSQTTGGTAKVQGNAAASNYKGLVMRRVQRAKRSSGVRGEALVRFRVTASGGLAGLSLARSSGSGKLDAIALAQVRRAAPFPAPPPGAPTSFAVRIKGK